MASDERMIGCVGAGRMGRGIAVAFAFAGYRAALIDLKFRSDAQWDILVSEAKREIEADLRFLLKASGLDERPLQVMMERVAYVRMEAAPEALGNCRLLFEGVPEIMEAKAEAFRLMGEHIPSDCIVASTTSTFDANQLAGLYMHPQQLINAHWLNPAHLIPVVEVSPSSRTAAHVTETLCDILRSIGKRPVICKSSPGYIVPRLQGLVMNEAARMVEEGVATAEEIDEAVRLGFGLRFSVLGLLEFIDWGGCDILYYGAKYLEEQLGERYETPDIIRHHMNNGQRGIRDGKGFYDYAAVDVAAYREGRLADFAQALTQRGLMPPAATKEKQL